MLRVNIKSDLAAHLTGVGKIPKQVIQDTYKYFVAVTPIRTGNARRSTRLSGMNIDLNYPYADKLDGGSSPQAPQGMSSEAEKFLEDAMKKQIAKKKDK